MFELQVLDGNDPEFIRLVSRVGIGAARIAGVARLGVIRIDHWFSEQWVGFRGKVVGAAGVREYLGRSGMDWRVPPFHPHRVVSETYYELPPDGPPRGPLEPATRLHTWRSSESNTRLRLASVAEPGVYIWFNSDSLATRRGSLLAYTCADGNASGWYVGFEKDDDWRFTSRVEIGEGEWRLILDASRVSEE